MHIRSRTNPRGNQPYERTIRPPAPKPGKIIQHERNHETIKCTKPNHGSHETVPRHRYEECRAPCGLKPDNRLNTRFSSVMRFVRAHAASRHVRQAINVCGKPVMPYASRRIKQVSVCAARPPAVRSCSRVSTPRLYRACKTSKARQYAVQCGGRVNC